MLDNVRLRPIVFCLLWTCLLLPHRAFAWQVAATPPAGPYFACVGQPFTITFTAQVTGEDVPENTNNCTVMRTEVWTGTDAANEGKVTKTFNAVGEEQITVTVAATYSYTRAPVTGPECAQAHTETSPAATITVCVVQPGTAPTGIGEMNYEKTGDDPPPGENFKGAGEPSKFGETQGLGISEVDITPYFDCATKKWKCKVVQAKSQYKTYARRNGRQEASADVAVNNPGNAAHYCTINDDLKGVPPNYLQWVVLAAVQAHEGAHLQEWKTIANAKFATMKATIEALTVDHACGQTTDQAKTLLKALPAYTEAIDKANADAAQAWNNVGHHTINTKAAERPPLKTVLDAIEAKRLEHDWPDCPGGQIVYFPAPGRLL